MYRKKQHMKGSVRFVVLGIHWGSQNASPVDKAAGSRGDEKTKIYPCAIFFSNLNLAQEREKRERSK